MKSWRLPAWLNGQNVEVISISGFMHLEIRITSTLRYLDRLAGWEVVCISFRKTSNTQNDMRKFTWTHR